LRRFVSLNAEGFRDRAHAIEADDGVRRLLIVGDSVAFGWGIVRLEDRFGEQLATRLKSATGIEWEAINASRPDSATPEHLLFLDAMSRYQPDVVVLLYVFNDIDYLSRVTPRAQWGRFTPVAILFRNSYLFQESYVRVRRWMGAAETATNPYLDEQLLARHITDVSRFVANGQALGATVKVVPIAPSIVVEPSVRHMYERFLSHASAAGIPVCSLAQAFGSESFDALTVNALDRHPSARAHRLAAEATAPCLSES
jgi:lysophospholipase L1-like esterase